MQTNYKYKFIIAAVFLIAATTHTFAQSTSGGSPYSKFGIGDLNPTALAQNCAMGGTGLALQSTTQLTLMNAASLSALKLTSFEFGVNNHSLSLQSNNTATPLNKTNQNLSYIALGFPVGKRFGAAVGLIPYSRMDYNIVNEVRNTPLARNEVYRGTGGFNKYFVELGAKVNKNLYLGATIDYLDGTISRESFTVFPDTGAYYNLRTTYNIEPNAVIFTGAVQYKAKLKENSYLSIGATYQPKQQSTSKGTYTTDRFRFGREGQYIIKDTVQNQTLNQVTTMPQSYGIGITYEPNQKLTLLTDISRQDWRTAQIPSSDSLFLRQTIAVGLQYTPAKTALRGQYYKVINYRAGFYTTASHVVLRGTPINEIGITLGVGLPISDRVAFSQCNISADFGQRGTLQNNLILERYARVTLGFTLSDKWFVKRRYD
jgi:hypothetical protein